MFAFANNTVRWRDDTDAACGGNVRRLDLWIIPDRTPLPPNSIGLLSPGEKARYVRYESDTARRNFLAGRVLTRHALSRLALESTKAPHPPEGWDIGVNEYGRPELAADRGITDLHFNLSRTTGAVALLASRQEPVGVDIERVCQDDLDIATSETALTSAERGRIECLSVPEQRAEFLRVWTMKEAVLKFLGLGFSLDPRSFEIVGTPPRVMGAVAGGGISDDIVMDSRTFQTLAGDFMVAVATRSSEMGNVVVFVRAGPPWFDACGRHAQLDVRSAVAPF